MRFKTFLQESEIGMVSSPIPSQSVSELNMETLNDRLSYDTEESFVSAEAGVYKISQVLHVYGLSLPLMYEVDPEGDEIVIDLTDNLSIYIVYSPTDDGRYEFYAEVGDEARMQELLDEGAEEEE